MSEAPKEAPAAKKFISYNPEYKTEEQKKEEVCCLVMQVYIIALDYCDSVF